MIIIQSVILGLYEIVITIFKKNQNKSFKNGKQKTKTVHRLVALAFIPNPNEKPYVNHINNLKLDNNIKNLRWVSRTENNMNANLKNNNSSGVKGVEFDEKKQNWRARIRKDRIEFHIGRSNVEYGK